MRKVTILILSIVSIVSLLAGCINVQIEIPDEVFNVMIMVDDKIYTYTGYEVPVEIDRGAILGKISSTVKEYEMPMENGQANFEIKDARFARYEDDMVVFLNNKWILFKNQEDMISGFSVNNFGFLMEDFSDEDIFRVFRTIRKYIIVDDNYEANLYSIIETSFRECGIDDQSIIEAAKSNLDITVSPPKPTISSQAFKLNQLSAREYTIREENLYETDDEFIIHFGQSFVNLFNGAVGEQVDVRFEKYISNPNLLKFADKMLELTQKQDLLGRNSVNYGWNNEFKKIKIERINDNLSYLELPYQFEGSGNSCKILVTSEDKTLKIVDFYFGSKDGIDTITTGHHAERKLDNPNLWNDEEWVRDVFSKLEELEEELGLIPSNTSNSTTNDVDYTNEDASVSASSIILENDLENATQEEMTKIYQLNYGWTDLKSHELFWDGDTILIRFYFSVNAKRWEIDAARAYAYKEMKNMYINNYEPTPYQFWRMYKFHELKPVVCTEVYIDDILLVQDFYEDEISIKYENTSLIVDSRRMDSTWTKEFDQFIENQKKINNVVYQNSLLGKAVIIQIYSNDIIGHDITTEIKDYIKEKIASKATRENEQDTDNEGKYIYIVLELYKGEEKYYEDVLINQGEIEWKQFDWMNN